MQAALALIADRPARRRRRQGHGRPWIVLASAAAHLLVLGGLVAGVHVMPPMVEPPALTVELMTPARPPAPAAKTLARPAEARSARTPALAAPRPTRALTPPPVAALPAARGEIIAPPGFRASGSLTGGGEALRQAARQGGGCNHADIVKLTKAEREACAERLGEKHKNGPALYAVIDPDKKAAFDGDCKKDDDWCLYRAGKGPYPGLFALGKKRKIKGWD